MIYCGNSDIITHVHVNIHMYFVYTSCTHRVDALITRQGVL